MFIASTYRDRDGFLGPLATDAGRPANNASSGSTFCAGVGKADDVLDGGKPDSDGVDTFTGGVAERDGVGAGGSKVLV